MTSALAQLLAEHTAEHLQLVGIAMLVAVLFGVPAGIAVSRRSAPQHVLLGFASVVQTIPSLALFGFLIPLPGGGIGPRTAVIALVLYALLPVLRNTVAGLVGVDPVVREAAIAMGMTSKQLLWQVELPLAAGTIFAGIRTAMVTTIGTATIAAAIGGGGLGVLIFRGVAMLDTRQILAGAAAAAVIALLADGLLGWIEKRLSPA